MSIQTIGYAAYDALGLLKPFKFELQKCGSDDVHIRIVACGVCATDINIVKNIYQVSKYPVVPGHEIVGYVEAVGENVTKVKRGDKVGVGILAETCGTCVCCVKKLEQYCQSHVLRSLGCSTKDGSVFQGGYARDIVCHENYVARFPANLDMYEGASLMCAGITVYSPLKKYELDKPGKKLGVIGLGGLGHMAVKFGVAFGLEVTVISHSEKKREEALGVLGAHKFINSTDLKNFDEAKDSLDFIIDTVNFEKDMDMYLSLLSVDGTLMIVAIPEKPLAVNVSLLLKSRRNIAGSILGSIEEVEEMLEFCGTNNIGAMIEKISMDYINTAYERLAKSDVHYRFVLDIENTCPRI